MKAVGLGVQHMSGDQSGKEEDLHKAPESSPMREKAMLDKKPDVISSVAIVADGKTSRTAELLERRARAVVKIFVTKQHANYSLPWKLKCQSHSEGSGFILPNRQIGTAAHVVHAALLIEVQKQGADGAKKYVAKVRHIAHQPDLAVLELDTTPEKAEEFWKDRVVLPFVDLPPQQTKVTVLGFPVGDRNLSVTVGVVSRCISTTYVQSSTTLLAIQVDAAINNGNSGGPAFCGEGICGVVFQSFGKSQNGGGMLVPACLIQLMLNDIKYNGRVTGLSILSDLHCMCCENPGMRRYLQLADNQHGVYVHEVGPLSLVKGLLLPGDVLTEIDGKDVGDDGTIELRRNSGMVSERACFSQLVATSGEPHCLMKVLRLDSDGKQRTAHTVCLRLIPSVDPLVTKTEALIKPPRYLIWGGYVFTRCSFQYLDDEFGPNWNSVPSSMLDLITHGTRLSEDHELVVLSQVLSHPSTLGFNTIANRVVHRVNGMPITNLDQLAKLIAGRSQHKDDDMGFLTLDLDKHGFIAIDARAAHQSQRAILKEHQIDKACSDDLSHHFASSDLPLFR